MESPEATMLSHKGDVMGLHAEDMTEIAALLTVSDTLSIAELRRRFPSLSVTRCDASDVSETPYLSAGFYDLHLLDGREHCVKLTNDPAVATGVILAKRKAPA